MQLVVAPRAGTVQRVVGGFDGAQIAAGDDLLVLVPEVTVQAVEVYIDGNDVPLVHPGDQARIQFEGWPALQFSGWPQASIGTFPAEVLVVDASDVGNGQFRVLVVPPAGTTWPIQLRQGGLAKGWILLRSVPLGYELWRQLNNFPPSLVVATSAEGGEASGKKKKDKAEKSDDYE